MTDFKIDVVHHLGKPMKPTVELNLSNSKEKGEYSLLLHFLDEDALNSSVAMYEFIAKMSKDKNAAEIHQAMQEEMKKAFFHAKSMVEETEKKSDLYNLDVEFETEEARKAAIQLFDVINEYSPENREKVILFLRDELANHIKEAKEEVEKPKEEVPE